MCEWKNIDSAVLGCGAWGTTFALVLAGAGGNVRMWGRNSDVVSFINSHENSSYLPGIDLPNNVSASTQIADVVEGAQLVAVVVPVAAVRATLEMASPYLGENTLLLLLAKGLEPESNALLVDVAAEATGVDRSRIAVLSGPNLSREIASGQPAATVVACSDLDNARTIAQACHTPTFRPYLSSDVVGCEIAGATKNVIAVAIGAAEGMGLGVNTRATLITRGLAEMTRLGTAMGAEPLTFSGLAGVGDLVTTCSSRLSRNYSFGYRMGQGMGLEEALSLSPGVVEGVRSARPILDVAQSLGVDMPITSAVVSVIHEGGSIPEMGQMLLSRPRKMDGWDIAEV
ncbi:MAG: NAD(P)H-dependent glycerol-3-phosphate dehydrogenase [Actinomycetaceae bacterium]|nr:NAD(P)H-dependent glycerol-3-phosphate dehydrogenase [Actinomycetaceae bacterium]